MLDQKLYLVLLNYTLDSFETPQNPTILIIKKYNRK